MKKSIYTFLLFVLALAGSSRLGATDYTFNASLGNWNTPTDWLPVGVPGQGDNVIINTGNIVLHSDVSVNNFTQNGGIVQGLGAINIAGDLIWNIGDFNNEGPITVTGGLISVNPSPSANVNLIRSYGALVLNGGGNLENPKMAFLNGADFEVVAGTTLTINATVDFVRISVTSTGSTLNFQGDIIKNGSKGCSLSNAEFTLANQITINQGVFGIGGNPSNIINLNGCIVTMSSGTTFRMNSGTLTLLLEVAALLMFQLAPSILTLEIHFQLQLFSI
jgi:hypothetical protein